MNNEYISQLESARRLQVSYKGITSLSKKFPDKLPCTVKIRKGRNNFFFKASDVQVFKKFLDLQNRPKQIENNVQQQLLTQRERLRNGFVFKDGKWL